MSNHRTTVILVVALSLSLSLQAQNLIRNGGFTESAPRVGDGSIPPNQVADWRAAYRSPQLIAGPGCQDVGFIAMWGNKAVGEAITQTVSLKKGLTYEVALCARYRKSSVPYAHVELRASTSPLRDPYCEENCETMPGPKKITSTAWAPYRFRFTPARDYAYVTVSVSNDVAVNDGARVSWAEIDNVSIAISPSPDGIAPILNQDSPAAIAGQYIVVMKAGASRDDLTRAEGTAKQLGGTILFRYTSALLGYGAKLPPAALQAVRKVPGVGWIEVDQKANLTTEQLGPPKGLDRTSERLQPLDGRYTYSESGTGVHVYVIDTGIRVTHTEFGVRASGDFTSISDGNGTNDCNGHGTHVAGTIGGSTFGIAKDVRLHGVRVSDCFGGGSDITILAGVDWVTANRILPAVANMSLALPPGWASPALDMGVTNSVASGVTYAIAAGNFNLDACTISPALVPTAITVGSVDPNNDTRASDSDWGVCLDLFGPGVGILSSWITSDTATNTISGTSMATPHVAGVAARYLQNHPTATPATVLAAIHANADVVTTPGWTGIVNPGVGSPNELLHWGSLNDGFDDGDPHLTTVNGTHYNFQSAGEFVLLRGGGLEIQTRQTPVATTFDPGPDPYDGLATCVSLNTAVAARVGSHRVTYEPNVSGVPDPSGLQLRVDGVLTNLTTQGLNLAGGGRVARAPAGGGLEIVFPDETILVATPGWWASQGKWYLNVHVARTRAAEGIIGAIVPGSWLPALPSGASMGAMPASLHQRYVDLNSTFADAWRVSRATSLFDYAPGTSTATFTLRTWPPETPPCKIPKTKPAKPSTPAVAQNACNGIANEEMRADCVFDVIVTGEIGFAKTYLISQQIRTGGTTVTIEDPRDPTSYGETATFTAIVAPMVSTGKGVPAGYVQFIVDGVKASELLRLENGRATWKAERLKAGVRTVSARYSPERGGASLASTSVEEAHTVRVSIIASSVQPQQ